MSKKGDRVCGNDMRSDRAGRSHQHDRQGARRPRRSTGEANMSAPIQNRDKLEDLRLYAPPWAREHPAPQQRESGQVSIAEAPAAGPAHGGAAIDLVEPSAPPLSVPEARAEDPHDRKQPPAPAPARAKPIPRMPPGVGGPN